MVGFCSVVTCGESVPGRLARPYLRGRLRVLGGLGRLEEPPSPPITPLNLSDLCAESRSRLLSLRHCWLAVNPAPVAGPGCLVSARALVTRFCLLGCRWLGFVAVVTCGESVPGRLARPYLRGRLRVLGGLGRLEEPPSPPITPLNLSDLCAESRSRLLSLRHCWLAVNPAPVAGPGCLDFARPLVKRFFLVVCRWLGFVAVVTCGESVPGRLARPYLRGRLRVLGGLDRLEEPLLPPITP